MSDGVGHLVTMANQIATFFASQPGDTGAAGVADHLRAFWEPRMRRRLITWTREGGEGLHPLAAEAVELLQAAQQGDIRQALAQAGKPSARAPGDDAG